MAFLCFSTKSKTNPQICGVRCSRWSGRSWSKSLISESTTIYKPIYDIWTTFVFIGHEYACIHLVCSVHSTWRMSHNELFVSAFVLQLLAAHVHLWAIVCKETLRLGSILILDIGTIGLSTCVAMCATMLITWKHRAACPFAAHLIVFMHCPGLIYGLALVSFVFGEEGRSSEVSVYSKDISIAINRMLKTGIFTVKETH